MSTKQAPIPPAPRLPQPIADEELAEVTGGSSDGEVASEAFGGSSSPAPSEMTAQRRRGPIVY